jgi:hypothetical protein
LVSRLAGRLTLKVRPSSSVTLAGHIAAQAELELEAAGGILVAGVCIGSKSPPADLLGRSWGAGAAILPRSESYRGSGERGAFLGKKSRPRLEPARDSRGAGSWRHGTRADWVCFSLASRTIPASYFGRRESVKRLTAALIAASWRLAAARVGWLPRTLPVLLLRRTNRLPTLTITCRPRRSRGPQRARPPRSGRKSRRCRMSAVACSWWSSRAPAPGWGWPPYRRRQRS